MEADAKAFEEEKKNNPEEADDHDTRKLPKPERMRLVAKNKEVEAHRASVRKYCVATLSVLCLWAVGALCTRRQQQVVSQSCFS